MVVFAQGERAERVVDTSVDTRQDTSVETSWDRGVWVVRERGTFYPASVSGPAPDRLADPDPAEAADDLLLLGERCAAHYMASDALQYEAMVLLAEFDAREGWRHTAFGSSAEWLAWRIGVGAGAARERVRTARALRELPLTSAAMQAGELSFTKVRALTRVARPESEAALLEFARSCSAARLERRLRSWTHESRAEEPAGEARRHASRCFSVFPDEHGMYAVRGRLDPEVGAVLMRAIDAAGDALWRSRADDADGAGRNSTHAPGDATPDHDAMTRARDEVTPAQRRADAVGLVAERVLAAGFRGRDACLDADAHAEGSADADGGAETDGGTEAEGDALGERTGAPRLSGSRAERYLVVLHVEPATLRAGSGAGLGVGDGAENGASAHGDVSAETSGPEDEAGRRPLSQLADGVRVSAETSRRLACDASVVRVTRASGSTDATRPGGVVATGDAALRGGAVLDVGRRTRTIPPALRRALEVRDGGCRHPGCGSRFTDAHHIEHWADGGPTRLENLVLLCRGHHRAVHEGRVRVCRGADDSIVFFAPDGSVLYDAPRRGCRSSAIGAPAPGGALRGKRTQTSVPEPRLDVPAWRTGAARWARDRDVPWAIEVRALDAIERVAGW